ncbi:hypothetical protein ACJX0J_031526, partial [Zea mays]
MILIWICYDIILYSILEYRASLPILEYRASLHAGFLVAIWEECCCYQYGVLTHRIYALLALEQASTVFNTGNKYCGFLEILWSNQTQIDLKTIGYIMQSILGKPILDGSPGYTIIRAAIVDLQLQEYFHKWNNIEYMQQSHIIYLFGLEFNITPLSKSMTNDFIYRRNIFLLFNFRNTPRNYTFLRGLKTPNKNIFDGILAHLFFIH